jgi:2-polyprenyl-3-methyl-5-hydroxy-6-metoxy-1,4-benzoquinol methylase
MARRAMPTWQERITHDTEPAIRVEHDLRYRYAGPAIAGAKLWCDLGCGNGVAAAAARPEGFTGQILLVDLDGGALQAAVSEIEGARTLQADLSNPADVARLADELKGKGAVVTCFEVIEHLETFVPLVEMLESLKGATVIMSVPNDAFWATENPHHKTMWGEGAFAELQSLLPEGHTVAPQVQLTGSAIALDEDGCVPTHFLASWGGAAPGSVREVVTTDLEAERDWVRRREADLSFYKAAYEQVLKEKDELTALVREHFARFDEWRSYIHDLERRLGLPLSGVSADESPRELPAAPDDAQS